MGGMRVAAAPMSVAVEGIAIIAMVGVVTRAMSSAARVVVAVRATGVTIAIVVAGVSEVEITIDAVVVAAVIGVVVAVIRPVRPAVAGIVGIVDARAEQQGRHHGDEEERE